MHINILVMRYSVLYSYLFELLNYIFTKLFKTTFQKDTILQKYVKKPIYNFENNLKMEQMESVCASHNDNVHSYVCFVAMETLYQ